MSELFQVLCIKALTFDLTMSMTCKEPVTSSENIPALERQTSLIKHV